MTLRQKYIIRDKDNVVNPFNNKAILNSNAPTNTVSNYTKQNQFLK